jgi:predicted Zn finger-like uncharacterized protein
VSLITRCPKCATAFRATREQLSKRAGRVRCGKCGEVFDGIKALVEQGSEPLAAAAADETHDTAALPAFMAEKVRPPRALWWTLCALALLLLAAQAVYHYRAELASRAPWSRAPLVEACELLGCEVPLPRQLGLLTIDSYEVRADPRRDGVILLTAVIRNRAPYAQAYPALQFALTDDSGKQVVSRVLRPTEYLERTQAESLIDKGIAPSGEAELNVYFDTSRTRASGYRLELFYPS